MNSGGSLSSRKGDGGERLAAGEILPPFCISRGDEHFCSKPHFCSIEDFYITPDPLIYPKDGEKKAILPKILYSRLDRVSSKSYIK
jgi:hypothetical protein